MLGLATALSKGAADVRYFAAQNSSFCPESEARAAGGGTTGTTGGDPHLFSFGLQAFDFQAAGEFTLVKSTNSHDLEVQVRQQPIPHSHSLAYNSAVAMRVGSAIFEVELTNGLSLNVYVNHRIDALQERQAQSGGGSFSIERDSGSGRVPHRHPHRPLEGRHDRRRRRRCSGCARQAATRPGCRYGQARARPARAHHRPARQRGRAAGPRVREPQRHPLQRPRDRRRTTSTRSTPRSSTRSSAGSWRISQKESLFTYARHKSTSSYTISGFPEQSFYLGSVSPATAQQATTACINNGITNRAVLADCEYDVAATGDEQYASDDAQLQEVTGAGPPLPQAPNERTPAPTPPPPPLPPPPPPNPGIDLGAGTAHPSIAYDPGSGETYVAWQDPASSDVVDLCAVPAGASTCNGGAGPYRLTDPLASKAPAEPAYFAAKVLVQPSGTVVVLTNVDGANKAVLPGGYTFANGVIAWSSPAGGATFGTPGQGLANAGKLLAEQPGSGRHAGRRCGGARRNAHPHLRRQLPVRQRRDGLHARGAGTRAPRPVDRQRRQVRRTVRRRRPGRLDAAPAQASTSRWRRRRRQRLRRGCEETGFSFVVGTPAALQTATWPAFKGIACQANSAVLAGGGPSGGAIGVVDAEGAGLEGAGSDGVYWRAFDATTHTFTAPVLISDETAVTLDGPSGAERLLRRRRRPLRRLVGQPRRGARLQQHRRLELAAAAGHRHPGQRSGRRRSERGTRTDRLHVRIAGVSGPLGMRVPPRAPARSTWVQATSRRWARGQDCVLVCSCSARPLDDRVDLQLFFVALHERELQPGRAEAFSHRGSFQVLERATDEPLVFLHRVRLGVGDRRGQLHRVARHGRDHRAAHLQPVAAAGRFDHVDACARPEVDADRVLRRPQGRRRDHAQLPAERARHDFARRGARARADAAATLAAGEGDHHAADRVRARVFTTAGGL